MVVKALVAFLHAPADVISIKCQPTEEETTMSTSSPVLQIAAWQNKAGIKPATGREAELLRKMSNAAFELIKLIELERSGIRDGDGEWHDDSDVMGSVTRELKALLWEYLRLTRGDDVAPPLPDGALDEY